jgi:predicted dehydrogenase
MFRIGIIGTENTHALAFSKIINLPDPVSGKRLYPDAKVVGVYGPDMVSAQAIIDETGAEFIAESPDAFHGKVDAMLITSRKGSLHAGYAMPFIEKGMPLFIDKPFTTDVAEAQKLIEAAKKSGARLSGGSGCKLAYDVLLLQNSVRGLVACGNMISASMNYAADPDSEYDGFWFYAPHLTEMALAAFGHDVRSVSTVENNGSRISIWRYDSFDVSLHYTKGTFASSAVVYAKTGNIIRSIDNSLIYFHEVERFIHMLRTGEMPETYDELILPVRVIAAVEESLKTGKEVIIS